jgi:hypothetical protein
MSEVALLTSKRAKLSAMASRGKKSAETAMRIRERILAAAEEKLLGCDTGQILETFIENAMLRLLKDSEDRGLGSPVQPMSSPEGGPLTIHWKNADN